MQTWGERIPSAPHGIPLRELEKSGGKFKEDQLIGTCVLNALEAV
jgi:hypothetical protein